MQQDDGKATNRPGSKWSLVGTVSFGTSAGCEVGLPAGFARFLLLLSCVKAKFCVAGLGTTWTGSWQRRGLHVLGWTVRLL